MSTVHVIGAAGYAGAQLAALVDAHPHFTLGQVTARGDAGMRIVDVAPAYRVDAVLQDLDLGALRAGEFAAVCYPHAEAAAVVGEIIDRGLRVVDVSADHRLGDAAAYPRWYGFDHPRPDLLAEAVYGLPEVNREAIAGARLVANPGCYPTASLLALLPLMGRLADIVIDAKSGVSGAGKTPTPDVHYCSVADSVRAYKVLNHRHTPEIAEQIGAEVLFTPHLVPVDRGLLASVYARIEGDVPSQDALRALYDDFYSDASFVEVVDAPPGMHAVQHTNFAQVCPVVDEATGRLIAFGVIDNLMKGAASQAVQNLNLMAGRPETEGLL
jgi:N-acetyl-gamma-glutamyl-phosphate reductase